MRNTLLVCGTIALACGIAPSSAEAADLASFYGQSDDADAVPPQQYTFGTGWYLRGDLTASDDIEPGVFRGVPAKRDWGYGAGGGAGYQFNDYFRADLTGDYLSTQKFVGHDVFGDLYKSNVRRFDGLANGYFDLGTWAGFTPYIGAGIGFSGLRTDASVASAPPSTTIDRLPGKTQYNLAWAALAGVSYHVSTNLLLDIGYRYLDLGSYRSPLTGKSTDMNAHEIRAGIRYMIY